MSNFKLEVFLNPNLSLGADIVTAAMTVSGEVSSSNMAVQRVFGLVIDTSGSMTEPSDANRNMSKIEVAKKAAILCVNDIPDGMEFFIISFSGSAKIVMKRTMANNNTRHDACTAISKMIADGGTAISKPLIACGEQIKGLSENAICMVVLLTDGDNHANDVPHVAQEVAALRGRVQVHCRGLGTDWKRVPLQAISDDLMGTIGFISRPEVLTEDFKTVLAQTMTKSLSDLRLRFWMPKSTTIKSFKQMFPTELDITSKMVEVDARSVEFPLGSWGQDSQDYQVVFSTIPRTPDGLSTAISRPTLVYTDPADGQLITVQAEVHYDPLPEWSEIRSGVVESAWSENISLTMRVNKMVSHYGDEGEKTIAKQEFSEAWEKGDDATATLRLRKVMELAESSGDEATKRMVRQVADVDESTGTINLKRRGQVDKSAVMDIDVASTRTIRARRG